MSDLFEIELNVLSPNQQLKKLGINDNGPAQRHFVADLMRRSNDYLPKRDGILQASARMSSKGDAIIYETPYARYHWYGKLAVDPVYGKGAFFKEGYGFWSRRDVKKVITSKNMQYHEAPRRGPHWVTRCYMDNRYALTKATGKYIKEYSNGNHRSS